MSHDAYLSKPDMHSHKRRLFTFTNPILLSHDGAIVTTAAEGVEDDEPTKTMRFLVLDAVWDGKTMTRIWKDGEEAVIGAWFSVTVIASEQVLAPSLIGVGRYLPNTRK
jgi:hypothetical protein